MPFYRVVANPMSCEVMEYWDCGANCDKCEPAYRVDKVTEAADELSAKINVLGFDFMMLEEIVAQDCQAYIIEEDSVMRHVGAPTLPGLE